MWPPPCALKRSARPRRSPLYVDVAGSGCDSVGARLARPRRRAVQHRMRARRLRSRAVHRVPPASQLRAGSDGARLPVRGLLRADVLTAAAAPPSTLAPVVQQRVPPPDVRLLERCRHPRLLSATGAGLRLRRLLSARLSAAAATTTATVAGGAAAAVATAVASVAAAAAATAAALTLTTALAAFAAARVQPDSGVQQHVPRGPDVPRVVPDRQVLMPGAPRPLLPVRRLLQRRPTDANDAAARAATAVAAGAASGRSCGAVDRSGRDSGHARSRRPRLLPLALRARWPRPARRLDRIGWPAVPPAQRHVWRRAR